MSNNKIEAVITIKKIGEKDNKFWIQDNEGEFYSGFKEYQGTQNLEYSELLGGNHGEPFKEGDSAFIQFTKSVGKDDKIYKNLRHIFPADGKTPTQTSKTLYKSNSGSTEHSSGVDWDKLGLIKAYHNLIAAYIAKGETYNQLLEHISNGHLWVICKTIEEDVTKRTATGWKKAEAIYKKEEVPPMMMGTPDMMDDGFNSLAEQGPGFVDEEWKFN